MIEIWRDIKDYEGLYQVSNFGRVKSLNYNHTGQEQILKPNKNKDGYLVVGLHKNGKSKQFRVHRLVGMAFADLVDWVEDAKGKPFSELEINHKKEMEKANNHVSNLEWCDRKYNNKYGTHNERMAKTKTNGKKSKPVYQFTLDGEFVREWPSVREVERQTGYNNSFISACCRGDYKQAYGYIWSYNKVV